MGLLSLMGVVNLLLIDLTKLGVLVSVAELELVTGFFEPLESFELPASEFLII